MPTIDRSRHRMAKCEPPLLQGELRGHRAMSYLEVLRAELPIKDVNVANHVVLTSGLGDDTSAVL